MEITKLKKSQLSGALDLVWSVFSEFVAPDYSLQGVNEFKAFIDRESMMKKFDSGELEFYGCIEGGGPVGVIAIRDNCHLCLLFVKKEYQNRGIAKKLFETAKKICRENNAEKITVNSSPYAKEAYHRLGFVDAGSEQIVNGIRFIPMVYRPGSGVC
ncbi:MAG: putative acyltransferase [Firmicutes bacterium ADurb.Bin182]|nr:MAG: putative acyltransferase [Firmicutes bacterium ADurb.Bin182]